MTVVIENAWWLGAAGGVAALVVFFWMVAQKRSRRWRIVCVGLPGMAAILAGLALAGLGAKWNPVAQKIVILLDLSPSARTSPWYGPGGATWLKDLAELRLGPAREVTVVGFGGANSPRLLLDDVRISDADHWPTQWPSPPKDAGSDITPALAWRSSEEARAASAPSPRWLITDGLVAGAVPDPMPFDLGWTQIAPDQPDVGILELSVHAASGDSPHGLDLWARLRATAPTPARLTIERDGQIVSRQAVPFAQGGARWITFHDGTADAAVSHLYRITIERAPAPDPWPENDAGSILWQPSTEPPRVLIVGAAEESDLLAGGRGKERGVVSPGQFPENVSQLLAQRWQVIVLNDVGLAADPADPSSASTGILSAPAVEVLDQFVRDTGGGLVILGKKHAFGPGHYAEAAGGRLEALSPVWSQPRDRPAARIIFVLDASGSMNEPAAGTNAGSERKFRLAARGVEQATELLKDQDRLTILTFSDHCQKIAGGTKEQLVSGPDILRDRLKQVLPTGNTIPDSALPEVTAALQQKDADTEGGSVMVVLLTDGEIPAMDTAKWKAALRQGGAKLTIIAPSPSSEKSALGTLAQAVSATWLATDDAGEWASLLQRAVADELMGRAMTTPLAWKSVDGKLSGETRQWIEVWPKQPDAQILASSEGASPRSLAAVAQRGLGRVAAIAFADNSPADAQLFQQILHDVMPPPGDRRFTLSALRDDHPNTWRITADAAQDGKFLDNERLQIRIFAEKSGAAASVLEMPQVAPGRYEARLMESEPFAGTVFRETSTDEGLVGRISPARIEPGEWPASVEQSAIPRDVEQISSNDTDRRQWSPRIRGWEISFTDGFWLASSFAVLASLWGRRAPEDILH